MSEDLDLLERFEPLASAPFAPPTDTAVLRARVASRRRRRRALVAGGIAAVVALIGGLGVLAALAVPGDDGPIDELRTVAPTETEEDPVPASYGTEPRLVIGVVPSALSSEGCSPQYFGTGETASCLLGVPATTLDDGMMIVMRPAAPAVTASWAQADAAALADLAGTDSASFTTIGGRNVLDLGETRTPGRAGRPERVYHRYEVLVGDSVISVQAENITDEQLDQVIGGLGTEPVDLGFATPVDALPAGARAIAQGQERLWGQPDPMDASRSDDNGGDVAGITYAIGDDVAPLVVHVVRDVDAASYIDTWADQQAGSELPVQPVVANGRAGHLAYLQYGGIAAESGSGSGERIAVAADDDTVIIVEGKTSLHESLLAVAGRTRVAAKAPAPAPETPAADGVGWYLPEGLPEGWVLDRASAQATDGSGEAQLWLTSPSGNVVVVTLRVPRDGYGPSARTKEHRLPGSSPPVYVDPRGEGTGGGLFRYLTTVRDDAFIDVILLGGPGGESASPAGDDETDELMASLVPATTDEWRAALSEVPAPPILLDAPSLVDLPDAT